jgi:hypothetical protein
MDQKKEKLITVFSTGNHGLIALAKSVLDDVGIRYYAKNESTEDLIGLGVFGTGFNIAIGPIELQVFEENVEEAKKLLKDITEENNKT